MKTSPQRHWTSLRMSERTALTVSILGVLTVALGDFLTGPYLVFATFYLIPVAVTAWFSRRNAAIAIAFLASSTGVLSTVADPGGIRPPVYLWNGFFRFITYIVVVLLIANVRTSMETIEDLAATDPLTGLMNRRQFYRAAERELALASRSGSSVAVVYIDVDDLKHRNDTYGHEAGDEMLLEFANATRATTRATDLIARLGGDEFCLFFPGADSHSADELIRRLRTRLHECELFPIHFSAGIVSGPVAANDMVDIETMIRQADTLMFEAKRAGKGRTVSQ